MNVSMFVKAVVTEGYIKLKLVLRTALVEWKTLEGKTSSLTITGQCFTTHGDTAKAETMRVGQRRLYLPRKVWYSYFFCVSDFCAISLYFSVLH